MPPDAPTDAWAKAATEASASDVRLEPWQMGNPTFSDLIPRPQSPPRDSGGPPKPDPDPRPPTPDPSPTT